MEGVEVTDDGTLIFYIRKKESETQSSCGTDFTGLVCLRGPDESCLSAEALKNWTWQDAVGGVLRSSVHTVRGKGRGRRAWHLVLLSNKSEEYKKRFLKKLKSGNIDVDNWGYSLKSGWGKDPPQNIKDKANNWMYI